MVQPRIVALTVNDVGEILQIGRNKSYELFKRDDFPSFNLGRQLRVYELDFVEWLNKQKD